MLSFDGKYLKILLLLACVRGSYALRCVGIGGSLLLVSVLTVL